MTTEPESNLDAATEPAKVRTDSLAISVVLMLGVTVLQRGVGFFRGVLFCGMLQDDELGRWSLAFSFLVLAAPLVVLGLPGSLGRYVEHFRQRGQLRVFIARLSWISCGLSAAAILGMLVAPGWLAWLIFGDANSTALVYWLAAALASVIVFNFLTELFTALRQTRVVSMMQLTASLLFAAFAVLLIFGTSLRESAIIIAFAASSLVASLLAVAFLIPLWQTLQSEEPTNLEKNTFWKRLAPFAIGIWLTDLLANLFDVSDRLMLVHFGNMTSEQTDALLGQYHAARIIPVLIIVLVRMGASIMLPYLAEAWEKGKRDHVAASLKLVLKSLAIASVLGGACILLMAPSLYHLAFGNKFGLGVTVLPLVLNVSLWLALGSFLHSYLQCAERANYGCIALVCGLCVNIVFNLLLVPSYGLWGAIAATGIANVAAMGVLLVFCHRLNFKPDFGLLVCLALPLALIAPLPFTFAIAAVALSLALFTNLLYSVEEKQFLCRILHDSLQTYAPAVAARCQFLAQPTLTTLPTLQPESGNSTVHQIPMQ